MNRPPPPTQETPLWKFSLAVYGSDGVAAECLALQERFAVDVNLLLFVAFAGAVEGVALNAREVAAAAESVSGWHADIVRALRGARQRLKPMSLDAHDSHRAAATALRAKVKAAELESEKIEQAMLWDHWRRQSGAYTPGNRSEALAANLRALLVHYGAPAEPKESVPRLQTAALAFATSKS